MLKIYSAIYCAVLMILIILFLIASFLVGAAGHSSVGNKSDYFFFTYPIITIICLIIYRERQYKILKYINLILVIIPVGFIIYSLFQMYIEDGFYFWVTFFSLLFITLSLLLIRSIIKN